jgi:uncharacterized phiE125 gp8 family phage protein
MYDYNLTLITPPAAEPLALADIKQYLRIDTDMTGDDAYITALITVARQYCEDFQHRAYITQTWELALSKFPRGENDRLNDNQQRPIIEIPKGNLQSIVSFSYTDYSGTVSTLASPTNYLISTRGILGRLIPPYGVIWPSTPLLPIDPIVIRYICGYGDSADKIPQKIIQAMMMLVSHWYANRMVINDLRGVVPDEISFAVTALLYLDRIITL